MEKVQRFDVSHDEMKKLPKIIAVDFDGTLVEDEYPKIGKIIEFTWNKLIEEINNGAHAILWTCRDGEQLRNAVQFCLDNGLEFSAINCNLRETQDMFQNDTRKVYANEYWDDKANPVFSYRHTNNAHKNGFNPHETVVGRRIDAGLWN
jgi:hydroxymethylpyrimidine pyrophosphatase-like HAD family hydrolase